jgi:hypothetical protein
MAEFSKQYCEIHQPEMGWDFDIEEIAEGIPKGHYKPIICEGFGFSGIGVRLDGTIQLLFRDYIEEDIQNDGLYKQIDYKKFIEKQRLKSQGI